MSEYWKSTPKYWCKHCKVYVKDTKFEKSSHEASGRHQGNIKRFLRDLQRGMENKEKEKERGKRELERVTNIVEGKSGGGSGSGSGSGGASSSSMALPPRPQATPAQRKQQLAQLAEMGVSIPSEFRGDLAMVGDWEVVNEKVVMEGEKGPDGLAMGVRKREVREGEEEDEEERVVKRGKWMSLFKTYPSEDDDGLDELFNRATSKGKGISRPLDVKIESTIDATALKSEEITTKVEDSQGEVVIKRESPGEAAHDWATSELNTATVDIKEMGAPSAGGIVFKKRKPKNVRQK